MSEVGEFGTLAPSLEQRRQDQDAKPAAAFRVPRVEAPNCGLGEFQSCSADASCAPAARARPSAD